MITCSKNLANFFTGEPVKIYFRGGRCLGSKNNGVWKTYFKNTSEIRLTRAQGYKYWAKYFPDRVYWSLPITLQEAIDSEPRTYICKNGVIYVG